MKRICIVSSCYNESDNIDNFYSEVIKQTERLDNYEWNFIIADNCSTDNTAEKLRAIAAKDSRVKVIINQSNYGPDRSAINALFAAKGDAIIPMASDLEDPPDMIPEFVKAWENGYKVVMGQYKSRKDNPAIKVFRKVYYKTISAFSDFNVENNVTGFGLYDMSVIDRIRNLDEYIFTLRFLCPELGYDVKYITFEKPKRKEGKSSYSFFKYYKYAVETFVLTSHAPLHLACLIGFSISMISFIIAIYYLIQKLVHWYSFDLGLAPIMIGIFFIGGIQLFFIGIIGEYLSSVIKRVTKRPYVIEKERINFENNNDESTTKEEK